MRVRLTFTVLLSIAAAWGLAGDAHGQADDPPMSAVIDALGGMLPPEAVLTVGPIAGDPVAGTGTVDEVRVRFEPPPRAGALGRRGDAALRGLTIGRLELTGARLDPARRPVAARSIVARDYAFSLEGGIEGRIDELAYADVDLGGAFTLDLLTSPGATMTTGPVELRGMSLVQPDERLSARLEHARLDSVAGWAVSGWLLEGLTIDSAQARLAVARLAVPRVDDEPLRSLLAGGGVGPAARDADPLAILAAVIGAVPELAIEGIEVAETSAGGAAVRVERVGYRFAGGDGPDATMSLAVRDLVVRPETGRPRSPLDAEVAGVPFGLEAELLVDEAARRLRLEPVRLTASGQATLTLTAELGAVPPTAGVAPGDARRLGELTALVPLRRAALTLDDEGFFERALARRAADRGVGRAELGRLVRGQIEAALAGTALAPGEPAVAAALDAVESFLRRPGRFELAFTPADPQALALVALMARRMPALLLAESSIVYTPPPSP